jgi:hypothetical protein
MLWSLSGNLSLVHKVLFGIEFQTDSLAFHPFIPKALAGSRSLTNFKCRNAILDIEMSGFGNKIKSFSLDGKLAKSAAISYKLKGLHTIKIVLSSTEIPHSIVNKVSNYTTIETPIAKYSNETLTWSAIDGAKKYQILRNGKVHKTTIQTSCVINSDYYAEYQVIAIDANNVSSFASEPVAVIIPRFEKTYQLENFTSKAVYDYKGYLGDGFVEISKTVNQKVIIPIDISKTGTFAISFRYANGNGPINTENKCAIRTLKSDEKFAGTIVLPQRGVNEWSIWGMTNSVQINLTKGRHILSLTLESTNENMNGDINQAMIDALIIKQLR